ncbi:MAG: nucleotide exchange factor GrpE, partial [Acidobacteriota bacterium]
MNPKEQIPVPGESVDEIEIDMDATSSVDDFIKELEAKEKDLHITSDLTIEIAESEFDDPDVPEFVKQDLPQVPEKIEAPAARVPTEGLKTKVYELEKEVESLKVRLTNLRAERNEVQEKSDRRLKDFEAYKYRMDRERRGAFIDQISNLASQMLPVIDNLSRALDSADEIESEKSPEFVNFHDGIVLVHQQVTEIFEGMGVQSIEAVGEIFDPNFHEAVAVEERTDRPANTILEEMLRGYRIGNRVIRHSMVKVTTAPPKPKTEAVWLDPDEDPENRSVVEDSAPTEPNVETETNVESESESESEFSETDASSTEA